MMPSPGGVHLCAAVHEVKPDAPVVLTSGFSREYVQSMFPAGNWRFLQKPVDEDALLRTLAALWTA
jgi:YesN/AraC family two-component response regulator